MPDSTNPTAPNDETLNGTDPQTPETGTSAPGETPETTPTLEDLLKERDELKNALKKTNAEFATHRRKAKELDDLKAQIEAEKLSEAERAQKKISDLQAKNEETERMLKERTASYEVQLRATQMGIVDPEVAVQLIKGQIDYDDAGSPTNIEDLLKELAKTKPYLVGKTAPVISSGGATNPSRSQTNAQPINWDVISKMTKQEYDARKDEVQQFMTKNLRW